MKKENKGITLIALIISTIVMLILVSVTVSATIKSGLIGKTKEAKTKYEKEQIKERIGACIDYNLDLIDLKKTAQNIKKAFGSNVSIEPEDITNEKSIIATVKENNNEYRYKITTKKITEKQNPLIITKDNIKFVSDQADAEACKGIYYTDAGGNLKDKNLPLECGDSVIYGDYEYKYEYHYAISGEFTVEDYNISEAKWGLGANESKYPWGVRVLHRDKTNYGQLATEIFNKKVSIERAFQCCDKLEVVAELPEGIESIKETFKYCYNLEKMPEIPESVINMAGCFAYCRNLKEVSELPNGVVKLEYAFTYCKNLTKVCAIPETVENLLCTFYKCSNLESVSEIPKNVKHMYETFTDCENLGGIIRINSSSVINSYGNCFDFDSRAGVNAEKKYGNGQCSIKLVGNGENDDIIEALASIGKYVTY